LAVLQEEITENAAEVRKLKDTFVSTLDDALTNKHVVMRTISREMRSKLLTTARDAIEKKLIALALQHQPKEQSTKRPATDSQSGTTCLPTNYYNSLRSDAPPFKLRRTEQEKQSQAQVIYLSSKTSYSVKRLAKHCTNAILIINKVSSIKNIDTFKNI
jgi:HD-GYP domain-containing protein (c-di-GMP phosphodiesterase class II)